MSYKSYFEYNRTDPNNLVLDNIENEIDSLEQAYLSLMRKDNMKCK